MHPSQLFYSRVVVRGGKLQEHFLVKFHFMVCVSIDFYWSLDKISHNAAKRPSPRCSHVWKTDRFRVFFLLSVDVLGEGVYLCGCVCMRGAVTLHLHP